MSGILVYLPGKKKFPVVLCVIHIPNGEKEQTGMVKNYAKFEEVGIRQIKPEGWLGDFLRKQAEGLTGHLEVAGIPLTGWAGIASM